jgi:hypothetical protein
MFLIFFLVILFLFLVVYIIPILKKYKTNKAELTRYEKMYRKQQGSITLVEKKREILKKKYKKSLRFYEKEFNKEHFKNFIKTNIEDSKIEFVDKNQKFNCSITGKINSIDKVNQLIEKINNYESIVKINFPITIKKIEKSYFVSISVTIINKNLKNNL